MLPATVESALAVGEDAGRVDAGGVVDVSRSRCRASGATVSATVLLALVLVVLVTEVRSEMLRPGMPAAGTSAPAATPPRAGLVEPDGSAAAGAAATKGEQAREGGEVGLAHRGSPGGRFRAAGGAAGPFRPAR
jgi:hypothetical protein